MVCRLCKQQQQPKKETCEGKHTLQLDTQFFCDRQSLGANDECHLETEVHDAPQKTFGFRSISRESCISADKLQRLSNDQKQRYCGLQCMVPK